MATILEDIENILQANKNGLHVEHITDQLISREWYKSISRAEAIRKVNAILSKKAKDKKSRISHIKNKNGGNKRGWYRIIQERKPRPSGSSNNVLATSIKGLSSDVPAISSTMLGKAGEYAVVSRLLLNGYIANIMSVDDGIDIIATQGQNVFFVQVKTATVGQNQRCKFSIKKSAYNRGHLLQIRYIMVARYGDNNMLFIKLTEDDIKRLREYISAANNTINFNVKFENRKAFIYKGDQQTELDYCLDDFEL